MEVQEYQQNLQGDLQVWQAERTTDLQKYGSDIQNELNEFNKENIAYQSAIQESIQQIQITNQVNLAQAQSDLQAATTNKDRDLQRQLQNGVNDMQAIVNDNQRKIALYQAEAATYQGNMQNELNEFNKENISFQANIQEAMQEIQVANQVQIAQGQASLQVAIDNKNRSQQRSLQNGINDMQAIVQNNDDLIAKYSAELQQYQLEVANKTQEATVKGQNVQFFESQASKYYAWAQDEVAKYIQNNSKMINTKIAAQAQTPSQQQQYRR